MILYSAGSRDSALTNHGYQQALRLGQHFAALGLAFTHIFSSHLQRAVKTADLIRYAQAALTGDDGSTVSLPAVVQLPGLMERDFGCYEGKKFDARGTELDRQARQDTPDFVDVESKQSLARRADGFLDEHLLPLLESSAKEPESIIAVVSHGILLSALWKRLLLRLPAKSVTMSPKLATTVRNNIEHLGGWSNTGYLELHMMHKPAKHPLVSVDPCPSPTLAPSVPDLREPGASAVVVVSGINIDPSEPSTATTRSAAVASAPVSPKLGIEWVTMIKTVNGKDHLKNLKRTGGGIGSSRHDTSQKNINSFFKRRKLE